ncbi:hypothetical protein [Cellulomonas sp. Y8]|uniref:hypothetical protein n=1 Tax=Cellulomonas sp. Y8 TaxID=2591145 RepID=UPI0011CA1DA4|nr:hypothetical protein [Cellulomonas sp. Y8]
MTDQPAPPARGPVETSGAARTSPPSAPGSDRWSLAAADAWTVVSRCLAILLGLLAVAGAVGLVSDVAAGGGGQAITSIAWIGGLAWLVHALATLVVGYPAGLFVSRLLPVGASRAGAGVAYALAGAGCGAGTIVVLSGLADADFPGWPWAVLGAVVAGGARIWAHGTIRRRHAAPAGAPGVFRGR